jgi:hypothetical protein
VRTTSSQVVNILIGEGIKRTAKPWTRVYRSSASVAYVGVTAIGKTSLCIPVSPAT